MSRRRRIGDMSPAEQAVQRALWREQYHRRFAADPEPFRKRCRDRYAADPERHRQRCREHYAAGPEQGRERVRQYRARVKAAQVFGPAKR